MATITSRGNRQWRVQVRRKGHAPVYRTFDTYADAKKWSDELEGRISGETYVDRSEAKGTKLREDMADWSMVAVQPKDIAEWRRKQEAAGKAPSTVNNAINLLSSVYRTAIGEWGYPITNPCQGDRPDRERQDTDPGRRHGPSFPQGRQDADLLRAILAR
jgi:hypothetical protein